MQRGRSPLFRLTATAMLLLAVGGPVWVWRDFGGKDKTDRTDRAAKTDGEPGPAVTGLPGDTLADAVEISRRDTPDAERPGWIDRVRLTRGPARFPLIRSEEKIRPDGSRESGRAMAADQVTVTLRADAAESAMLDLFAPLGGTVRRRLPLSGQYIIAFPNADTETVPKALALLETDAARALLKTAEADWIVSANRLPDDLRFSELWGLNNSGQTGGSADADIDAPEAWDFTTGSRAVTVAVIDTGVDHTHPDLVPNMWSNPAEANGLPGVDDDGNGYVDDVRGWDWANGDNDPMDDNRHGTHCAGTLGAAGNDGAGVSGVCWKVTIMPLKFLSGGGSGLTSDAAEAVAYATRMGAAVTSNSWGGGGYSQTLKDAIEAGGKAVALFVTAAGNDAMNADAAGDFPGGFDSPCIVNVAASDASDQLTGFSNFGAVTVDLAAPGALILSTVPGGGYALLNGTSMAAPHVAGAAALLKSFRPALTPGDLKQLLLDSADHAPAFAGKCVSNGRLNVYSAMVRLTDLLLTPADGLAATGRQGGPFLPESMEWTLVNNGANPATWTAAADAPWVSVDPASGTVAAGGTVRVRAALTPAVGALGAGTHRATVTVTNPASGLIQRRPVELRAESPGSLPFREDFEGAFPSAWWTSRGTGNFRTRVAETNGPHGGRRHLLMDEALDSGAYARNELTLTLDTAGFENPDLTFFAKGFNEDPDGPPPSPHTGSVDYDGVSLSVDGVSWYEVAGLRDITDSWKQYRVDLGAAMTRHGLTMGGILRLRFVQYDNYSLVSDGIALDDIEVTGVPARRLEWKPLAGPLAENGAPVSAELTLSRAPAAPLTVHVLTSSSETLAVPGTITIPAGAVSAAVLLTPINDSLANGTRSVTLTATASDYQAAATTAEVDDDESASVSVILPATVTEGAADAEGEVRLPFPAAGAVRVPLVSGDPARLTLPAAAVIPAGQTSARFPLGLPQNQTIEAPVEVSVSTAVRGWPVAAAATRIVDDESRALTVTLPASARESDGIRNADGRVSVSGPLAEALRVALLSSRAGRLTAPGEVIIPAGESSVTFSLTLIDNAVTDGVERVAVTASAAGFTAGAGLIDVYDNESPPAPRNPFPAHLTTDAEPESDLAWTLDGDPAGVGFEVYFGDTPELTAAHLLGATTALTWPLPRLAVDGAYFWRVAARYPEGLSAGPVWTFSVPPAGAAVGFTFEQVPTPQRVNRPFPVTITARDRHGSVSPSFTGAATLSTGTGPASTLLITEVNPNSPDTVEFTNVSGAPLDVSGWRVAFYDEYNHVSPVAEFTFPPGTIAAEDGILTIEEAGAAPGTAPAFRLGANLYWTTDSYSRIGVLVRNTEGEIVDFFCAALINPSAIAEPVAIPLGEWDGPSKTAPNDNLRAYIRTGDRDRNSGADWSYALPAIGAVNAGLSVPFVTPVPFRPGATGAFAAGVWSGEITVEAPGAVVKLVADDDAGRTGSSNAFRVESLGALTLAHPPALAEGSAAAPSLTVSLPAPATAATVVSVESSVPDALRVTPGFLVIPAGQRDSVFTLEAPENTTLDLTRGISLTASAEGFTTTVSTVEVIDDETGSLDLSLPLAVSEGELQAPSMAVVSVTPAPGSPLRISVMSGDPTELSVPAEVIIPAGQSAAAFFLTPVDDALLDGAQTVSVTVSRGGWQSVSGSLRVEDNESRALTLTVPGPLAEGGAGQSARIAVSGLLLEPVTVRLTSSEPATMSVPATVEIPAGESSVYFPLTFPDNPTPAAPTSLTLTAEAAGFVSVAQPVSVADNDPTGFVFAALPPDLATGAPVKVTITAIDAAGGTVAGYTGSPVLTAASLAGPADLRLDGPPVFSGGVWTGTVRFFTSAAAMRLRVQDGGGVSGDSEIFAVQPGPEIAVTAPSALEQPQDAIRSTALILTNTGGRPLQWTASFPAAVSGASSRPSPHTLSAGGGTLSGGESVTLILTTDTLDFPVGEWLTSVAITSNAVVRPMVQAGISVRVTSGESVFRVTPPASRHFSEVQGRTSEPREILLTNTGSRVLEWTTAGAPEWLTLTPATGSLAPGESAAVEARAVTGTLAAGSYSGTVEFRPRDRFSAPAGVAFSLLARPRAQRFEWSPLPGAAVTGGMIPVTLTARLEDDTVAEYFEESVRLSLSPSGPGVSPAVAGPFVGGVWTGTVSVGEAAAAVRFRARHMASGAEGLSSVIDVLNPAPVMLPEPAISGGGGNTVAWRALEGGVREYQAQWARTADFSDGVAGAWTLDQHHRFDPLPEEPLFFRARGRVMNDVSWTRAGGLALNEGTIENLLVEHGRLVLAPGPPQAVNFNTPGTFADTLFGGPGVNGYQLVASPSGPLIPVGNPPLPISSGGDAECRGLGDALMKPVPAHFFRDGQIDGYLQRSAPVPAAAGFWLRSSYTGQVIEGLHVAVRWLSLTTARVDVRKSVNGVSTLLGTPGAEFAASRYPTENLRLRVEAKGGELRIFLWRVTVAGGVVTEEPLEIDTDGSAEMRRTDPDPAAGYPGLSGQGISGAQVVFDDVTAAPWSGARPGQVVSPLITFPDLGRWGDLTWDGHRDSVLVDVLDAEGETLAANLGRYTPLDGLPGIGETPGIRLRARFLTLGGQLPELRAWSVSAYTSRPDQRTLWSAPVSSIQDNTPPTLRVTTPVVHTAEPPSQVTGMVIDSSGLREFSANGAPVFASPNGAWSTPVTTAPFMTITAADNAEPPNRASAVWHGVAVAGSGEAAGRELLAAAFPLGAPTAVLSGDSALLVRFTRPVLHNGLEYTLEVSPDLRSWRTVASPAVTARSLNPEGWTEALTWMAIESTSTSADRYARLRVTRTAE